MAELPKPVSVPAVEPAGEGPWSLLARAARESEALDSVDLALIRALSRGEEPAGPASAEKSLAFKTVTACLLTATKAGALRIPLDPAGMAPHLERFLSAAGGADPTGAARALADAFDSERRAGAYRGVLGAPPDFRPLLESRGGLYFQKHYAAEAATAENLRSILREPPRPLDPAGREAMEQVLRKLPLRVSGGAPMVFQPEQEAALELSLRSRLVIVSGGPGTGKTSLITNVLRAHARARGTTPDRIRLTAPTGRAAQRMAESLRRGLAGIDFSAAPGDQDDPSAAALDAALGNVPCETLHRLLAYNPRTGEFHRDRNRPLAADLIVVDEVSMLDIFLLARLLEAVPEGATLLLLGDMDQLPSVDAGAVLADLTMGDSAPLRDRLIQLRRSHRSDQSILAVADCINRQDADGALATMAPALQLPAAATPFPVPSGCRFLLPVPAPAATAHLATGPNPADLRLWLEAWIRLHYGSDYLALLQGPHPENRLEAIFARLEAARILTFTRKGWQGCESINRRLGERLAKDLDPRRAANAPGFHGAPILILENDRAQELYNGEVGVLLKEAGRRVAYFRKDGAYRAYPEAFLPRHETAFAMTVHKAQGSEYDQVLVILPEAGNRLLLKETLYTALTRARSFVGIYGETSVFREAVERKVVRESGLRELLISPANGLITQGITETRSCP